jgi:hypothetical protein
MDRSLPLLVAGFADGEVVWQPIEVLDYDLLGHLLACHLVIEHYMNHFIAMHPGARFNWSGARLSFAQKVALISGIPFPEEWNFVPAIKHLNAIRNRFGHKLNLTLTEVDVAPLAEYLRKCIYPKVKTEGVPSDPRAVLQLFTLVVCSYFAGAISHSTTHGLGHPLPSAA